MDKERTSETAPLLIGARQEGSYQLPSGNILIHEVTPGGMKQTRVVGPPGAPAPRTAAEFYASRGMPIDGTHHAAKESNGRADMDRVSRKISGLFRRRR